MKPVKVTKHGDHSTRRGLTSFSFFVDVCLQFPSNRRKWRQHKKQKNKTWHGNCCHESSESHDHNNCSQNVGANRTATMAFCQTPCFEKLFFLRFLANCPKSFRVTLSVKNNFFLNHSSFFGCYLKSEESFSQIFPTS